MRKLSEVLGKNKLLNRLRGYTGFQKLLFFFIPLFFFMALYEFFVNSGYPFPHWLKNLVSVVTLWLVVTSWAYLMIGAQAHWKEKTRNLTVNITSIVLAVSLLVLSFF